MDRDKLRKGPGKAASDKDARESLSYRKLAEEALRETEAKYRSLVEQIPAITYTAALEKAGPILYISPQVKNILGFSVGEYKADPDIWRKQLYPEDHDRVMAELISSRVSGRPFVSEYRMYAKDGRIVWFHNEAVVVEDARGNPLCLQGVMYDISARKAAEEALQKAYTDLEKRVDERTRDLLKINESLQNEIAERKTIEEELRKEKNKAERYLDIAEVMILALDRDQKVALINKKGCSILGVAQKEILGKNWFDSFIPKKQRADVKEVFEKLMRKEVEPPEYFENIVIAKNGQEKVIAWRNCTLKDETGAIAGTLSSGEDVTERKKIEAALQASEQKYRFLYYESQSFNVVVGLDETIKDINKTSLLALGYARDEVVGKSVMKFIVDEQKEKVRNIIRDSLLGKPTQGIDISIYAKGGSLHTVMFSPGNAALYEQGKLIGVIFTGIDITERKAMESSIRKAHDELESQVAQRTKEAIEINRRLSREIEARKEIEKIAQLRNALLKLSDRVSSRSEYLNATVKLIQGLSGCRCAGIRVLNEDGRIPFEAFVGFDGPFEGSENRLSILHDQCACVRVFARKPIPQDAGAMTDAGSFRCDNLIQFVSGLSEKEKAKYRGVCADKRFASVAIVPVTYKGETVAAVHLADERECMVPLNTVTLVESLTPLIGEGIHKFNMEDRVRQSYITQSVINALLRLSLKEVSTQEIIDRSLDILLSLSWLALESRGSIFLVEDGSQADKRAKTLVLKAQRGMPEYLQKECAKLPFGECLCGKAALLRKIQFASRVDESHEITYKGISPHGHYCVPILFGEKILGVINIYLQEGYTRNPRKEEFLVAIANALAGILMRKRTESRLYETNELLERMFSSTNVLIAYLDTDFNFIRVNEAFAEADGQPPEFYSGKNHFVLFPHVENESLFRRVIKTGEAYAAYSEPFAYARRLTGAATYWDMGLQPVKDPSGGVEGLVLSLIDVTRRKQAEEELIKIQKELIEAKHLSDMGTLAASIAHELRNPLGVIRTAAYNIRRKAMNPLIERNLANIEKKVLESDQIISNLLFYSKIKLPQYAQVRIYELLEECVLETRKRFPKPKVKVIKKYAAVKKKPVEADPLQIKEVLNNLLNNAFEALPKENGQVEIEGHFDEAKDEINICIKDNGTGMGQEDLRRLSEPFFTTKSKGTGLGLTVSYQIAALHNGRISVKTEKDKGTVFTVTLPVKRR